MSKLYAIRQIGKSNYWYDFVEDFTSAELDEHCVSNDFVYVKECQNNLGDLNPAWKDSEIVEIGIIADLEAKLAEKDEQLRAKIGNMKSNDFIKMCLQCGLMVDAKEKDNQDKISFAVEQLEQLKHDIWTDQQDDGWLDEQVDIYFLTEKIDNQIERLTHQHEDKGE